MAREPPETYEVEVESTTPKPVATTPTPNSVTPGSTTEQTLVTASCVQDLDKFAFTVPVFFFASFLQFEFVRFIKRRSSLY